MQYVTIHKEYKAFPKTVTNCGVSRTVAFKEHTYNHNQVQYLATTVMVLLYNVLCFVLFCCLCLILVGREDNGHNKLTYNPLLKHVLHILHSTHTSKLQYYQCGAFAFQWYFELMKSDKITLMHVFTNKRPNVNELLYTEGDYFSLSISLQCQWISTNV